MAANFLKGRHALINIEEPWEADIAREVCTGYIVDNGAYIAWRRGTLLGFDDYLSFVDCIKADLNFHWALIPDIIDGSVADNDALLRDWPDNTPGVPVYHMNEPVGRLEELVHKYPRVAIGSAGEYKLPGSQRWWTRMKILMAVATNPSGYPLTKLHGLRMMAPKIFAKIPFDSVDSSMVGRNAFAIMRRHRLDRLSAANLLADRIESSRYTNCWKRQPTLVSG